MDVNILVNDKKTVEFEVVGSDHTIPRLLVEKLNADANVEFAACKQDHPLVGHPKVIVKTKKGDAINVVVDALEELKDDLSSFKTKFKDAMK